MATNTISRFMPKGNEELPIYVEFLAENVPAVSSLHVARHFQKKHQHILRDIDQICSIIPTSFTASNFGRSTYQDATGRTLPCYLLSRDAFTLLVMSFTGKAAMQWKIRYIELFNCLEAAIRENIRTDAIEEARALPAAEADRKAAYLKGMQEGEKLQKRRDGLTRLIKVREYLQKGLTHREIGKILGVSRQAVTDTLRRARKMGLAA